jgi:hypothetical protein
MFVGRSAVRSIRAGLQKDGTGSTYTVFEVAIDPAGGASLSMKKHG